jgi:hypothetical protein
MTRNKDDCLAYAEECEVAAARSLSEIDKALWLTVASAWRQSADDKDARLEAPHGDLQSDP